MARAASSEDDSLLAASVRSRMTMEQAPQPGF